MKPIRFVPVIASALFLLGLSLFGFGSPAAAMATAELSVGNLTCGACVQKIEKAVSGMKGVTVIDVDLQNGLARVSYDDRVVSPAAVANRISKAGYPARVRLSSSAAVPAKRAVPSTAPKAPSGKPGCGGGCCATPKQG